ncbi:hypothetical protein QTP70_022444 [Hemibagrus guttatus]|uniref:EF-hand domain-containing protein n=1 Tax=Hemibagrus guttatus TaxID=175788 RepID=A0AAE0V3I2_9TELE|nr:hypothetical protein QTP70_022444 [Hemibagrus guttatus]KAK3563498.1 hypothetical protein QTP86_030363 [Hemibagrus guttatus]
MFYQKGNARRVRTPPTMLMRRNFVAEDQLEIKQVYKLLQLVNQKNKEQIQKLVHFGVSGLINLTEPKEGVSALHLASVDNDVELAHFLLSLNAHPDIQDKKGRTAMMLAAKHGNVDMVKFLASRQANLTMVDKEGKGLLFYCISPTGRHEQIMNMVLDMNMDVNSTSYTGKSVFMVACEHAEKCVNLSMLLLERGADPDVADPETGCTALMAAVTAGSVALVLRILSVYSADFNLTAKLGETALHMAASEGHAECCRFLFQRGGNMTKNKLGLLPSEVAMKNGHKAALKELRMAEQTLKTGKLTFFSEARLHDWSFEHKAVLRRAFQSAKAAELPVATVSNETFVSVLQAHHAPIHEESLAVIVSLHDKNRRGKISIGEFFAGCHFLPKNYQLSSYRSAKLKSEDSETSFAETTCNGRSEPVQTHTATDRPQVDVSEGASVNWKAKESYINLNQCVTRDEYELLELAFSQNIPVDTRDRMYKTPLMTACMKGKHQMAQFLISHGAELNSYDQFKWTALHHTCMAGHADIVKLLVDHGAIIDAATTNGVTPLMRAIQSCKPNCVEQLLNAGANVEATNKRGQDCMAIAQLYGTEKICQMVKIVLDKAMKRKSGKKLAPAHPRTQKPTSDKETPKRCMIAMNPDATNYLITFPSATVRGVPTVISSPRLERRLAERKIRFSKEDMMKLSVAKPVRKTRAKKPAKM